MSDDLGDHLSLPLPLEEISAESVTVFSETGGTATPETPLGAAFLWWCALSDPEEYREALEQLSYNPPVWGDYSEAAAAIAHRSITTVVEANLDREDIRYVKFIDYEGDGPARLFADAPLTDVWFATVVQPQGSDWWLVWGLNHNHMPTTEEVTRD